MCNLYVKIIMLKFFLLFQCSMWRFPLISHSLAKLVCFSGYLSGWGTSQTILNQLRLANPFRLVWNRLFSMDIHNNFNAITFGPISPGRPKIPKGPISPCQKKTKKKNIKSINKHKNVHCIIFYMPTEITVSKVSTIAMRLDVNNLMFVHLQ